MKFNINRHLPTILTGLGVLGAAGTGVSAAIAQHKVEEDLYNLRYYELEDGIEPTKKDYAKTYAKHYWPTAIIFALTSGCIVGSNKLNQKEYNTLLKAYGSLGAGFAAYRNGVIDEFGKEKDSELMDKAEAECVANYDSYICTSDLMNEIPDDVKWFYEPVTKQYFRKRERDVIHAEYLLNRDFAISGGAVNVSRLCEFLGIPGTHESDIRGWSAEYGYYWVDMSHRLMHKKYKGEPVWELCYTFLPEKDFEDYYNEGIMDDYYVSDSASGDKLY